MPMESAGNYGVNIQKYSQVRTPNSGGHQMSVVHIGKLVVQVRLPYSGPLQVTFPGC